VATVGGGTKGYLLVIGERAALAWILSEERMAFPARRMREAQGLAPGDHLLLYTTRGCFHNPNRDRGRVIGSARVGDVVRDLDDPIVFSGRRFPVGCPIRLESLVPLGHGVELAPLVPRLDAFPNSATWSVRMRRTLVGLSARDITLLLDELRSRLAPGLDAQAAYLAAAKKRRPTGDQ
jgi:hypothetical protein